MITTRKMIESRQNTQLLYVVVYVYSQLNSLRE